MQGSRGSVFLGQRLEAGTCLVWPRTAMGLVTCTLPSPVMFPLSGHSLSSWYLSPGQVLLVDLCSSAQMSPPPDVTSCPIPSSMHFLGMSTLISFMDSLSYRQLPVKVTSFLVQPTACDIPKRGIKAWPGHPRTPLKGYSSSRAPCGISLGPH